MLFTGAGIQAKQLIILFRLEYIPACVSVCLHKKEREKKQAMSGGGGFASISGVVSI